MAVLSAFFTRFGRTLRIIFKVPAAVLTTFTTCFEAFSTVFSKITGTYHDALPYFTSCYIGYVSTIRKYSVSLVVRYLISR